MLKMEQMLKLEPRGEFGELMMLDHVPTNLTVGAILNSLNTGFGVAVACTTSGARYVRVLSTSIRAREIVEIFTPHTQQSHPRGQKKNH